MGNIVVDTIFGLLISKPLEGAFQALKENYGEHQLKQSIEEFCAREFMAQFENADRNSEVNFGALKKYVLGEGLSLVNQVLTASPSVDTGHLRTSLHIRAQYYAGAKSDNAIEGTRRFISAIVTITSAFLTEKCAPEYRALANAGVENVNQNTNIMGNQILERFDQLESHLNNPDSTELSLFSDEPYTGFDGMPRHVIPCSEGSFDYFWYSFSGQKQESLLDVCLRDKHVVVVGEAGAGKTYALQQLFIEAKNLNYTQIFLKLKNYPYSDNLNKLLTTHSPVSSKYVIILDGYDEIASDKVGTFNSQINGIKNEIQTAHIVVSSRLNFYRYQNAEHTNLDGFKSYQLIPLKDSDKKDYALAHGIIDYQEFLDAVFSNSLQSLYENPFYFVEMIKYWQSTHALPGRVEFMQCIINKIIENDIYKYDDHRQRKIDEEKATIIQALEKIALIMQCLHCTELANEAYQKVLPSLELRELLKHIGLWSRNDKENWEFKHNNFREFCAASYLSRLSLEGVLQYTAMREDSPIIRPSWMNTFSYLALIRKNNDLMEWIQHNNPSLIVRFEKDRLKETDRLLAFKAIIAKHEDAGTWLESDSVPIPELVSFSESRDSTKYLLEKLTLKKADSRHTLNLLRVLKAFSSLHGLESVTHDILLNLACDMEQPLTIRIEAIKTMSIHGFFDLPDITQLVEQYGHAASEPEILMTLYRYLIKSGSCEKYIELLLWGRENINYQEDLSIGLNSVLYTGLKCTNSIEALNSIFTFFCRKPSELVSVYGKEDSELYEECCKKAAQLYDAENKPFIDCLCASLQQFSKHGANSGIIAIKEFMISTRTEGIFLASILSWPENEQLLPIEDLMCDGMASLLVEKYLEKAIKNEELIPWLAGRLNKTDPWFPLFDDAMLEKTGQRIPPRQNYNDLQQRQKDGYQRFFNSLFNIDAFDGIVKHIVDIIGEDVLVSELNPYTRDFDELYHNTDLSTCVVALHNFLGKTATVRVSEYQKAPNWEWEDFSLFWINHMLRNHKQDLMISAEQKATLKARCVNDLNKYGFPNIATDKGSIITCERHAFSALEILGMTNILCTQEQFLQMLMIPVCLFAEQKQKGFPDYITENVDSAALQECVIENIHKKELHGTVACSHIEYCAEHHLREATKLAIRYILSKNESDYSKSTAIRYLYDILGSEGIYDYILPHCQSECLLQLITEIIPSKDYSPELIAEISKAYQERKSETSDYWFALLLQLNNKEALLEYYQNAKASKSVPDHYDNNRIGDITEAIATINDIHLLDILYELLELSYSDGFIDNDGPWSLKSSAIKAIENIGVKNYQVVMKTLEGKKEEHKGIHALYLILIDIIESIKSKHDILSDEPLTLEEVDCQQLFGQKL